jgi:carbon-monoxide dehydrogenase small subunit
VLLDGEAVNSCLVLIGDTDGHEVLTVEGLTGDDGPSALQSAFAAAGAVQCGYCTPGMIVAAEALLRSNPDPTPAEIRRALSGVLCRCGTYPRVVGAVEAASRTGRSSP